MIKQEKFDSNTFIGMNITKGISLESILQATCALTGVTKESVVSKSRVGRLPYTRQLYSFIAYTLNQKIGSERQSHRKTLAEIANHINVDHSTVISHKYKIEGMSSLYTDIQSDIEAIKAKITIKNSGFNTLLILSFVVSLNLTILHKRPDIPINCDRFCSNWSP